MDKELKNVINQLEIEILKLQMAHQVWLKANREQA